MDESPWPPVGELIETISEGSTLEQYEEPRSRPVITGTRLIASYNWLDEGAKIIIPGKPPLWAPLSGRCQLREDDGIYYRDRNAASYPAHPLEPAIVSVMQMHPTPCHVDVFACGSTLGNLLRFTRGDDKPFRMLVEVVGETVHLIRRENTPKEQILGVRGYGHAFPEAYTTWEPDVKRSLSHQRILKYQFGGLDMMVRFEGDGYIKSGPATRKTSDGPEVLDQLQGLRLRHDQDEAGTNSRKGIADGLQVDNAGETVLQESIFELKTRSVKRQDSDVLGEQLPRLWVAQISKFILAYHDRGLFGDVSVRDVREEVQEWEAQNKDALGRLVTLLHRIIATAHSRQDGELEIVRQIGGALEVRRRASDAGTAFSETVRRDWAEWLDGADAVGTVEDNCSESSSDGEQDFTACDAECAYCGKC
ncbi:hypothetical protein EsDP_00005718 [Epichloe bromicola]|uniref:Geranylgeranyl pyrophosphate synthetase n=1 Tax=Epichloe bromicola TaxID=79588 RepID=A0ABQ0CVI6_9HYPO